jgi:hypothetical protein
MGDFPINSISAGSGSTAKVEASPPAKATPQSTDSPKIAVRPGYWLNNKIDDDMTILMWSTHPDEDPRELGYLNQTLIPIAKKTDVGKAELITRDAWVAFYASDAATENFDKIQNGYHGPRELERARADANKTARAYLNAARAEAKAWDDLKKKCPDDLDIARFARAAHAEVEEAQTREIHSGPANTRNRENALAKRASRAGES